MTGADADPPLLQLVGVSKTYDGSPPTHALREADLAVRTGELVAVVGPSGSGKSTLLNILGLLETPTSGRYLLAGAPVDPSGSRVDGIRARTFGFVFQASHMLAQRTVEENLDLALSIRGIPRRDRANAVGEALAAVGLSHKRTATTRNLSGGERQRAAIARALVTRPPLLLADEPTGNLDSATSDQVIELFRAINDAGTTVVVVTHSDVVAAAGSRQVRVRDGLVRSDPALPPAGRW